MNNSRTLGLFKNPLFQKSIAVLLAAAIVLSLILVAFHVFQGIMIQSLSQMNSEFVEQVDTISGTLLGIIDNTAMQMFYSSSVKTLRVGNALTNAQRTAGLRDLGNLVSSSEFLHSAMIYNAAMNCIFTSEGDHASVASDLFYDRSAVNLLISRRERGSGAPIKRQTNSSDCYSFLFYEPNVANSGSLLLNVRTDWYERRLLGISSGDNCVILDEKGSVVATGSEPLGTESQIVWPLLREQIEAGHESGFIISRNDKEGWMYCRLNSLGWYYLRAFSAETISPGMTRMRNVALGMLSVICILLLGGMLYALIMLYLPVRAIRKALKDAGAADTAMVQQVDKLLESQLEQRMSEKVECLLHGVEDEEVSFPAALILTNTPNSEEVRTLVEKHTQTITAKGDFGCLVVVSGCTDESLQELCFAISDTIGCRCLYGVPRETAAELAQCRQNLLELWQLRFLYAGQQVLSEKLIEACHAVPGFETKEAAPLFAALRAGQLDEARQCWKQIFEQIRHGRFSDVRFSVRYILKSLSALQTELGAEPMSVNRDMIDNLEDARILHQIMDSLFAHIVAAQDDRRRKRLDQLAVRIQERINAGYHDDALSAQNIADEMGMNAVYLGRLFREHTGMSISEAINHTRIKNAKALLLSTTDSIETISAIVGFNNHKYFYVVFKNIVGMTPKQFRSQTY